MSAFLGDYVTQCLPKMGCHGWRVNVVHKASEDDDYASIELVPGQQTATLSIHPAFYELNAEMKRETIAHELIHLHTARTAHKLEILGLAYLPRAGAKAFCALLDDELEDLTENMARLVADRLPEYDGP